MSGGQLRYVGCMRPLSGWTPRETARLLLRRLELPDLAAAVEIHTDPRTNIHETQPETVTEHNSALQFGKMLEHWDLHGFGVWAVESKPEPGRIIGFTGVSHRIIHERQTLNLSYRFHPDVWGRGLATESAKEAVLLARRNLSDLPVVAYAATGNIGSQRTALAAGLVRHTELDAYYASHKHVYFALGWEPASKPVSRTHQQ